MAILKNKTQGNYTNVSQNIMHDKNLSLTERGMMLTLLSLPDEWHLTIRGLCEILPDGRDKISNTINSLIEKGYVTRLQCRGGRGKFDSMDLEVHESPLTRPNGAVNDSDKDPSPCPENPYTVNPDTDKPCTDNPPQLNTYISNTEKVNNYRVCNNDTLSDSEYEVLISEFGKENVNHQIDRIKERGYKGCLNYTTIKNWCRERKDRLTGSSKPLRRKNTFCDFPQRDIDFDELERRLIKN